MQNAANIDQNEQLGQQNCKFVAEEFRGSFEEFRGVSRKSRKSSEEVSRTFEEFRGDAKETKFAILGESGLLLDDFS